MQKLSRSASGARHLRWAREIRATLSAHREVNTQLNSDQKKALAAAITKLDPRIEALTTAIEPYREFLDHAHVDVRARQRVANFLCDEAQRLADGSLRPHRIEIDSVLPGGYSAILAKTPLSRVLRAGHESTAGFAERAASLLRTLPAKIPGTTPLAESLEKAAGLLRSFIAEADTLEAQRAPLRAAVQKAIFELREELDQMDGRLRSHCSQVFIDSLYPELSRKGSAVADEEDEDDDAASPPDA